MEPIKVHVSIELNLSDDFKNFVANSITSLFPKDSKSPEVSTNVEAQKPKANTSTVKPVAPTPVSTEKPKEAASVEVSIEDVRKVLASKVADHRAEIKDKLNELGAPSVTKLEPTKYQEMLDFLNTLD